MTALALIGGVLFGFRFGSIRADAPSDFTRQGRSFVAACDMSGIVHDFIFRQGGGRNFLTRDPGDGGPCSDRTIVLFA